MSIEAKIAKILDGVDLGEPIYKIKVRYNSASIRELDDFKLPYNKEILIERLVEANVRRLFDYTERKYKLNHADILDRINDRLYRWAHEIYVECSPYTAPKRSKAYKEFSSMASANHKNQEFFDALFEICDYRFNCTKTESIRSKNNDVHRKNIYHLLNLMEKRYGKKSSN